MNEALSFTIKDGLGLNRPIIKTADGDEIVITGMSYKDRGKNRKQLDVGPEMEDHYTEDFILFGVGGKKYCVTREVTIYLDPPKGGKFNSKIVSVDRIAESVNRKESTMIEQLLSGKSIRSIILESDDLSTNESRKFEVGKKFWYKDKYGVSHECTVKSRVENDDIFDELKVADMTYTYPTFGEPKEITVPVYRSEQCDSYGDEYFVSDRSNGIANWVFP